MKDSFTTTDIDSRTPWASAGEIPGFPFDDYEQMRAAIRYGSFNIGVDPLAAAEWAESSGRGAGRLLIAGLSVLLILAAVAAVAVAIFFGNYWLLLALPIQAASFYLSHPASRFRKWVTVAGALSVYVVLDLLVRRMPTAALLVAYGGLTFAAVRIAAFLNNSAFRRALLSDEQLFLTAYATRACTLRNKETGAVYESPTG
ncbi:MAG TPA: hypothetical protein VE262_22490 [Blastocatellia bacterium]|nr:hypothetical protein [Blastocatellia bacterium]